VKSRTIVLCLLLATTLLSCTRRPAVGVDRSEADSGKIAFDRIPNTPVVFLSTQMNPVEEAAKMRNVILRDFTGTVDFRPNDNNYMLDQLALLRKRDASASILVGALHGDLVTLFESGSLMPVDAIYADLTGRELNSNLVNLGKMDGTHSYYVPWMQASFVMAANKKALKFLPKGATLESLTYVQLAEWAKAMREATGKAQLGFPAGEKGLMHRFFQGYAYPSYTGSTLLRFRSADAAVMWTYMRELWHDVNPGSLSYTTMDEPLIIDDVWVAWDHTARLRKAFETRPDDFVAFPAPVGPKGRGFMSVITGLAIPKGNPDTASAEVLIDYLTLPGIQKRMLAETGFFPVITIGDGDGVPANMRELSNAVNEQSSSPGAIPVLLPSGLGESGGTYNTVFMLTFSAIVLEGKDIARTLDDGARELQEIVDRENARCWLPDVSDRRPCRIE
jgi:multiple sugar transport system substrate-binding protein